MPFFLDDAPLNTKLKVTDCFLTGENRLRFFELGLFPNTIVIVKRVAPLLDPIELELYGASLCIRKEQAKYFLVTYNV